MAEKPKNCGGRPFSKKYELLNYSIKKTERGALNVICNIRLKVLANTALNRLQAHRNICKTPVEQEEVVFVEDESNLLANLSQKNGDEIILIPREEDHFPDAEVRKLKRQRKEKSNKLDTFIDKISETEAKKVSEAMATFFFACNIPFNVAESKFFKVFIKTIRPSFAKIIPCRKALSSKWLDTVYESQRAKSLTGLNRSSVMLIDGWKNSSSNTKIVVCTLHDCSSEKKVFINAWNLNGISETGDKLAEIVCEAIDLAKKDYDVDVFAVVSDNASNMIRMGRNLKHVLWHTTCNSHIGNLFAKEVVDPILNEKVTSILRHFKQPDFEQLLLEKGGTRVKLPCETRWATYRDSYKCLILNFPLMKIIAAESNHKVKQDVINLLFDINFFESVKKSIESFDPICELINECQNPETSLADAVNLWLLLKVPRNFKKFYDSRLQMALNEYSLAAYYLHPFYNNDVLYKEHLKKVYDFLFRNLSAEGLDEWDKYKEKQGIFSSLYEKEIKSPILFWKTAEFYAPSLSKLSIKLLKIPASSAEIERTFSKWSLIHTPIRNRLSFEKSKKLMHLYMSLRMEDNIQNEIEDDEDLNLLENI